MDSAGQFVEANHATCQLAPVSIEIGGHDAPLLRVTQLQHGAGAGVKLRGVVDARHWDTLRNLGQDARDAHVCQAMPLVQWVAATDGDGTYTIYARFDERSHNYSFIFTAQSDPSRGTGTSINRAGHGFVLNTLSYPSGWYLEDLTGSAPVPRAVLDVLGFASDESAPVGLELGLHYLDSFTAAQRYIGVWRASPRTGKEAPFDVPSALRVPLDTRLAFRSSCCTEPPAYDDVLRNPPSADLPTTRPLTIRRPGPPTTSAPRKTPHPLAVSELPFQPDFVSVFSLDAVFFAICPVAILVDSSSAICSITCDHQELLRWYAQEGRAMLQNS